MSAIGAFMDLTAHYNVRDIGKLDGAWEQEIDEQWHIAINGQEHKVEVVPDGGMAAEVPPFHFAVWFNGWIAALIHPLDGGMFAAGTAANEDSFVAAVEMHIGRAQVPAEDIPF